MIRLCLLVLPMRFIVSMLLAFFLTVSLWAQESAPSLEDKELEGKYDYFNHKHIQFAKSPKDGLLYAILDEAKYPIKKLGKAVFQDRQGSYLMFERTETGQISGYRLCQQNTTNFFRRIGNETIPPMTWFPRPLKGNAPEPFKYSMPTNLNDGLETGTLDSVGIDTGLIEKMVNDISNETHKNIHSVLVIRNGKLVLEEYFYQYDANKTHQLRSATKSVLSALAGIALDQKLLKSKDEKVLSFFPEYEIRNPSPEKEAITLEQLLTHQSGLECDDMEPRSAGNEVQMGASPDWVKFILDLPMMPNPQTKARYCSGGVIVLGRIIEKVSGKKLPDFAAENLFGKLGVNNFKWDFKPDNSSSEDFCQLHMRPRDMAKFGLLYLNEGKWNGKQLISSEWIKTSLSKHSVVNDTDYGYLWWRQWLNVKGTRVDGITAKGNGGQRIYLWPHLKMVVVITGGNYNERSPSDELQIRYILPATS